MKKIEWKQFRNTNYEASTDGQIRNKKTGKIMRQRNDNGYKRIDMQVDKKGVSFKVHRIIAEVFFRPGELGEQVDHIDRDRSNNKVENLRWVTPFKNAQNKAYSSITISCIEEIIEMYKLGKKADEIHFCLKNKVKN